MCASMQTDLRFCSLLLVGIVDELVHEIFQYSTRGSEARQAGLSFMLL